MLAQRVVHLLSWRVQQRPCDGDAASRALGAGVAGRFFRCSSCVVIDCCTFLVFFRRAFRSLSNCCCSTLTSKRRACSNCWWSTAASRSCAASHRSSLRRTLAACHTARRVRATARGRRLSRKKPAKLTKKKYEQTFCVSSSSSLDRCKWHRAFPRAHTDKMSEHAVQVKTRFQLRASNRLNGALQSLAALLCARLPLPDAHMRVRRENRRFLLSVSP